MSFVGMCLAVLGMFFATQDLSDVRAFLASALVGLGVFAAGLDRS